MEDRPVNKSTWGWGAVLCVLAGVSGCGGESETGTTGPAAGAAAMQEPAHVPGRLLVKFRASASQSERDGVFAGNSLASAGHVPQIDLHLTQVPEQALERVQAALARHPAVEYVEKDYILEPTELPNDPSYANQWHLAMIRASQAWDVTHGSAAIPVAILDSGVDPTHPDLAGKLIYGYNFYDNNPDSSDVYGHGTKVAGAAAAITGNGAGVAGVAWNNPIIPIRITDTAGYGYYSAMIAGITYAADRGARAANISFAIYNGSALTDAARYMHDRGGWVVAAGGNSGVLVNQVDNPYIVSVAATDSSDNVTSFSTYGPFIDLAAPGSAIYTTVRGGVYGYTSGTSFASPITAGVFALLFSASPSLTANQAFDILKASAVDRGAAGWDERSGWGRIDAGAALALVGGTPIDTAPPSVSITSPAAGATVSGTVSVAATASDNVGVARVEFTVDGVLRATDTSAPYGFAWDTTTATAGAHTLQARAYDAAGNVGTSSAIGVTVSNDSSDTTGPVMAFLSPTDGATVTGKVSISVSATDSSGMSRVEFLVDGVLKSTDSAAPWGWSWNSRSYRGRTVTLGVRGYDVRGNATTVTIQLTVR